MGISGRGLVVALPYLWLVLFFVVPFVIVLKISFSDVDLAIPPYKPLIDWVGQNALAIRINFNNYAFLFTDSLYINAFLNSIKVAFISTLLCLLIGYPIAYGMARLPRQWQPVAMMLVIVPFWTSFLIRIYAWINILQHDGLLNQILLALHLVSVPVVWLSTDSAMYLGIVYSYLPFMVLPLFATLEKLDHSLLEAAADLGSPPWRAFIDVTLPLSMPGVIAGSMLVFIPAIGEFVIPTLLGGPDNLMIGRVLWDEFFGNRDWPVASAVAIVFLVLLVGPIALYQHYSSKQLES